MAGPVTTSVETVMASNGAGSAASPEARVSETRIDIDMIETEAEVLRLREAWHDLLAECPAPNVFLSFEWFWPWWRHFGDAQCVIYRAREAGRLIGLLPMRRDHRSVLGIRVPVLRSMTNVHSPRYDLVVRRDRVAEVLRAWLEHLRQEAGWVAIELAYVPAESTTAMRLRDAARGRRLRVGMARHLVSPRLDVKGGFEDYLATRSKSFRDEVRYKERRLERLGGVAVEEVRNGQALPEALDTMFRVEAAGWKGEQGSAIRSSPVQEGFYRDVARLSAERGWLRLYLLKVDGDTVAANYALQYGTTFNTLKIGYLPSYAKYSPMVVLRKRVLNGLFREGEVHRFEMLGRCDPWKMRWTDEVSVTERTFVYSRGLRGTALFALDFGLPRLVRALPLARRVIAWWQRRGRSGLPGEAGSVTHTEA